MIKEQQKLKIGYNDHAEQSYKINKEAKIRAFNELLQYINTYIKDSEIDFNTSDLKAEIKNKVLAIYENQFPKIVTSDKILYLIGLEDEQLFAFVERFLSIDIEFNTKTKECPEVDFNIYAENEIQEQAFKKYNQLANDFNLNIDKISLGSIIRKQICFEFSNVIIYNDIKHKFEPNVNYILKLK
jgi:hypothetical protein